MQRSDRLVLTRDEAVSIAACLGITPDDFFASVSQQSLRRDQLQTLGRLLRLKRHLSLDLRSRCVDIWRDIINAVDLLSWNLLSPAASAANTVPATRPIQMPDTSAAPQQSSIPPAVPAAFVPVTPAPAQRMGFVPIRLMRPSDFARAMASSPATLPAVQTAAPSSAPRPSRPSPVKTKVVASVHKAAPPHTSNTRQSTDETLQAKRDPFATVRMNLVSQQFVTRLSSASRVSYDQPFWVDDGVKASCHAGQLRIHLRLVNMRNGEDAADAAVEAIFVNGNLLGPSLRPPIPKPKRTGRVVYSLSRAYDITALVMGGSNTLRFSAVILSSLVLSIDTISLRSIDDVAAGIPRKEARRLPGMHQDEIDVGEAKLSLRDPLSGSRIETPAKCTTCSHQGCFDLKSFLAYAQRFNVWECPICSSPCNDPATSLIVDTWFEGILRQTSRDLDFAIITAEGTLAASPVPRPSSEQPKPAADVIDLSDSDSDDEKALPPAFFGRNLSVPPRSAPLAHTVPVNKPVAMDITEATPPPNFSVTGLQPRPQPEAAVTAPPPDKDISSGFNELMRRLQSDSDMHATFRSIADAGHSQHVVARRWPYPVPRRESDYSSSSDDDIDEYERRLQTLPHGRHGPGPGTAGASAGTSEGSAIVIDDDDE